MKSKYYITTAIDYVNDKPHLGHALEKIQADVLARAARQKLGAENVWFLTGADEHGVKIARAAAKAGMEPQAFVDQTAAKFIALKEKLNLSWDQFIRTSAPEHLPGASKIWQALQAKGDIYKKNYRGLYCVGHEAFITEKDLVDGKCADHQKEPEVIEEENYFFRLSKHTEEIKKRIEAGEIEVVPTARRNEILSLLKNGLEDISFSRPTKSLTWGIPVPEDPEQTMYVWADALTNYISAVGYGRNEDWKNWWPVEAQVIGKDILRFHAAIWPAMLLSAELPLPKKLLVHGFITVDGQKMSKTIGNVIDPVEIAEQYGADALRYYLIKEIPTGEDGDFSLEKFKTLYNSDLANGLGNLAARVMKMATANEVEFDSVSEEEILGGELARAVGAELDNFHLNRAIQLVWAKIGELDLKIQQTEPFKLIKTDPAAAKRIIAELVSGLREIAVICAPFLPRATEEIRHAIEEKRTPPILFPRI